MIVTFDPSKRATTLKERGIDFATDAEKVFAGRTVTSEDDRADYGERRLQTVGHLSGRMVMIIWTPRGKVRHIISMRYFNARERERYSPEFK